MSVLLEKIPKDSDEYRLLEAMHVGGQAKAWAPKQFYESESGSLIKAKYTLKALQNAWNNSKKSAAKQIQIANTTGKSICCTVTRPSTL